MTEKLAEKLIEIIQELKENGKQKERLEFVVAYEEGLRWFENYKPELNYTYEDFLELIGKENGIKIDDDGMVYIEK